MDETFSPNVVLFKGEIFAYAINIFEFTRKEKSEERELSFVGIPRYTFILRRIWMNGVPSNSIKLNSHRIDPSTRLSSSVT